MTDSDRHSSTSKSTQSKSTEKNINEAEEMYRNFTYDLNSLVWDEDHLTNTSNIYCYCSRGIEYCRSMLQCCSCEQWFHTSCIRSIKINLLIGDQYFKFVCSVCNKLNGEEYCDRIIMKWSSVVGLTLSNLTYGGDQRFFNLESEIVPFITENESLFKLNIPLEKLSRDDLVKKVETILKENPDKFVQKGDSWALNVSFPYEDPLTFSPYSTNLSSTFVKQKSLNQNQLKANQRKPLANSKSKKKSDKDKLVLDGACRKGAAVSPPRVDNKLINQISKLDKKSSTSRQSNSNSPKNSTEDSNLIDWNRVKHKKRKNPNSILNLNKKTRQKPGQISDDDSDEFNNLPTLETLIPYPENFLGANNPFHVNFDEKQDQEIRKQRESRMNQAAAAAKDEQSKKDEQSNNGNANDDSQPEYRVVNKDSNLNKLIISRVNSINENSSNHHSTNNSRLNDKNLNPSEYLFDGKKEVKILAQRKTNNNNNIEYMLEITEKE